MDRSGNWSLSPAYDMTYSYNLSGAWTSTYQMSLNGKREYFELENFRACAKNASMKRGRAEEIVKQVRDAVANMKDFAKEAGVPEDIADKIAKAQRTDFI